MKLNVMDRLVIINTLPSEGNLITLKIIRDLKNQLGITEDEYKEFDFVQDSKGFKWNEKGAIEKTFDISDVTMDIIKKSLKSVEEKNKLTLEMLPSYEKIMSEKP